MDWSLVIFAVVVLYFAYRGYRNGLLKSISRVLSLIAGYACAILFTTELTPVVESQTGLQGIIALITASLVLFFGAGFIVSILFWALAKLLFDDGDPSTGSNLGGAAIGSAVGVLFAIVIVWALTFARDMTTSDSLQQAPNGKSSQIETLANQLAGTALSKALSLSPAEPEVARLGAAILQSPAEIAHHGQRLMASPDLNELLHNPTNQRILSSGDVVAVQELPAFQALTQNPDLQALAASTGLLDAAEQNGQSMETQLVQQITDIWGRTQRVKNNQRVQEIINDPVFQEQIRSGNPLQLLNNGELLELSDIIFSDEAAPPAPGTAPDSKVTPSRNTAQAESADEKTIYQWTDSSGRIYYSDQKPDS